MATKAQYQVAVVNDGISQTSVNIPAGNTESTILTCGGTSPTGIIIPPVWTSCNVSFNVSKLPAALDAGQVASVTITDEGSSYTSIPAVIFEGGGGQGAAGIAMLGFAISTVTVTNEGSGYTTLPTITASVGSGATFASTLGAVSQSVTTAGTGYEPTDTITLIGGTETTKTVLTVTNVKIVSMTNNGAGSGYLAGDVLILVGGTHSIQGTVVVLTVNGGGAITSFGIRLAGAYTVAPTSFTVTGGEGIGATFNAVLYGVNSATISTVGVYTVAPTNPVSQGSTSGSGTGATFTMSYGVSSITVSAGGQDYEGSTVISISGGGGTNAAATANLASSGGVKQVIMTSGGSNYEDAPSVGFVGGGGSSAAGTAVVNGYGMIPLQNFDGTDFAIYVPTGNVWIPLQPAQFNSITYVQISCSEAQEAAAVVDFALAPIFQGLHN